MEISKEIFSEIINKVGNNDYETGGILGSKDLKHVTHFCFDKYGYSTEVSYTPNVEYINAVLDNWTKEQIYFIGIVHSHVDNSSPSCADIAYAGEILKTLPHLENFYIPIITKTNDKKILNCFKITRKNDCFSFSPEFYNIF